MKNSIICFDFQEKYNTLKNSIEENKNIYLYGDGNNGKTYVINKLRNLLNEYEYFVMEYSKDEKINILERYLRDHKLVIQSNYDSSGEFLEFINNNNFAIIKFKGVYDKKQDIYV
jgi:hypothetical protein